jgi:hypothetical protein
VVLVAAGGSQLVASWHETAVRHVLCADHGELTHVTVASQPLGREQLVDSPLSTATTQETETADAHEHCAVAFLVRIGTAAPRPPAATRYTPPAQATRRTPVIAPCPERTVVLASAPKTSPPSV